MLIELIGQRRIDAIPALIKALDHSDRAVRSAALTALGNTVPDKYLSVLIAQVTAIADVYDALCSDRPFRARLPRELAT